MRIGYLLSLRRSWYRNWDICTESTEREPSSREQTTRTSRMSTGLTIHQKNDILLDQTVELQDQTLKALNRTKADAYQAEEIGNATLQELRDQSDQMKRILGDNQRTRAEIEKAEELVRKIGFLPFRIPNLFNLDENKKKEYMKIITIYEQQQYSFLSKTWSDSDFFSADNPTNSIKDIFDYSIAQEDGSKFWIVDFENSRIDSHGWTYAKSYSDIEKGNSKSSDEGFLFSLVRRRTWKRNRLTRNDPSLQQFNAVVSRNIDRQNVAIQSESSNKTTTTTPQTITVSTDQINFNLLTNRHNEMTSVQENRLKKIQTTDQAIDKGIDEVGEVVDRLDTISKVMNTETRVQKELLNVMDKNIEEDVDRLTAVNKKLEKKVDTTCTLCIIL